MKERIIKASFYYGIVCFLWLSLLSADEFRYEPPQNFKLNAKYIVTHHPATTSQLLAQLYFDQGFTFLYAFNHDAAYWSFLRATQVDPEMAMAYWGMAFALGANINKEISEKRSHVAYDTVQKAVLLVKKGTESEKAYIQALAQRYSNDPKADPKQLARNYSQAMQELSQRYPDDLDAAVLFADSILNINPWNQWSVDGKPLEGTLEVVETLQSVLKKDPNHLGANHYFVHAVEASSHPEVALMSAERLRTLLPSSGHILHMPSHLYILVGDYFQAARSNEAAIALDNEYIREYGIEGNYPIHYLSHNYYMLARAQTMLGRFENARHVADELVTFYTPHATNMPDLEYYASSPLTVLIAFRRWNSILDMPKPPANLPMTNTLWHFGRSLAWASLGDVSEALKEQRLFLDEKDKLSKDQAFGYNTANQILKIAVDCLDAKLAEAQENYPKALESLKKAIAEQDSLHYNEPPDWFYPVRESLGGLLLRIQQPAEAELVFREELKRHPRNGRALFGLRESLQMQSKTYDLYWVNQEFQKAWLYSDGPLTVKNL